MGIVPKYAAPIQPLQEGWQDCRLAPDSCDKRLMAYVYNYIKLFMQVLRHISDGMVQHMLERADYHQAGVRAAGRELLASCVLRQLILFFTPHNANKVVPCQTHSQQGALRSDKYLSSVCPLSFWNNVCDMHKTGKLLASVVASPTAEINKGMIHLRSIIQVCYCSWSTRQCHPARPDCLD